MNNHKVPHLHEDCQAASQATSCLGRGNSVHLLRAHLLEAASASSNSESCLPCLLGIAPEPISSPPAPLLCDCKVLLPLCL
jgi:hypothetical protein